MNKCERYDFMNGESYKYNQQNLENRHYLVELIQNASGMTKEKSAAAAKYACYMISFLFDIYFKNLEINNVSLDKMLRFLYNDDLFRREDSYQMDSSKNILKEMKKYNIIGNYDFLDVDYRYKDSSRETVYKKLLEEIAKDDFICARVCFGANAASDHAIIITNDNNGNSVVCDTSYRSHEYPENMLVKYITPENIRWWTQIS